MIWTLPPVRRCAAALIVAAWVAALAAWGASVSAPSAVAQTTTTNSPSVSVDPNTGAAGSATQLTLSNFDLLPNCNSQASTRQTCIYVDYIQGTRAPITVAVASGSNAAAIHIPVACTAPTNTNCTDPGAATIKATSPNGQTAQTTFTVTGPATTTTTTAGTTTSTSSTTSTSTTSSSTPSTSTTSTTAPAPTTTVPPKPKKSSSHSDVPRYIAVALVVLSAAATAAVDTRLRRIRL
ncbi:MAG: hypothetical protein JO265_11370 [Acidimicrobiia bacterium]|nr:hypothetical protein [Acidimicrobiia bacterium]